LCGPHVTEQNNLFQRAASAVSDYRVDVALVIAEVQGKDADTRHRFWQLYEQLTVDPRSERVGAVPLEDPEAPGENWQAQFGPHWLLYRIFEDREPPIVHGKLIDWADSDEG
jgi:hypothetical protein